MFRIKGIQFHHKPIETMNFEQWRDSLNDARASIRNAEDTLDSFTSRRSQKNLREAISAFPDEQKDRFTGLVQYVSTDIAAALSSVTIGRIGGNLGRLLKIVEDEIGKKAHLCKFIQNFKVAEENWQHLHDWCDIPFPDERGRSRLLRYVAIALHVVPLSGPVRPEHHHSVHDLVVTRQ